jgi:hypothetical protein
MIRLSDFPPRDLELLSTYLDGELTPEAAQTVERRLKEEEALRWALAELRSASRALKSLPEVRRPRSFILSREMAGLKPVHRRYPFLQLGAALATLALVVTLGLDALGSRLAGPALAPLAADNARTLSEGPPAREGRAAGEMPTQEAELPMLQAQQPLATASLESTVEAPLLAPSGLNPCAGATPPCTPGPEVGGGGGFPPAEGTTPSPEFGIGGGPAPEATQAPTEQLLAAAPSTQTTAPQGQALTAASTQAKLAPIGPAEGPGPLQDKGLLRVAEGLLALSALLFGGLASWQLRRR